MIGYTIHYGDRTNLPPDESLSSHAGHPGEGQEEAAWVWNACKDLHQEARRNGARWPNRDTLQKATKGRFALHSQTV